MTGPRKVLRTGPKEALQGDPLVHLEAELARYRYIPVQGSPPFTGQLINSRALRKLTKTITGGGIGYVSYDCVHYFEPKTQRPLSSPIDMPEAVFMFAETLVAFDHLFQTARVISHVLVSDKNNSVDSISAAYKKAQADILAIAEKLRSDTPILLPPQPKIPLPSPKAVSNVGEAGYKRFVASLKDNIVKGDIIQAVPSQRLRKETLLHPFNAYR